MLPLVLTLNSERYKQLVASDFPSVEACLSTVETTCDIWYYVLYSVKIFVSRLVSLQWRSV